MALLVRFSHAGAGGGLAGLLERGLIDVGEVWVTARALEDGLDTLLTRSRAEAELGELLADVERLETFARALDEVHDEDESLSRTCRVGDLALDVSFTRGAAKVRAKAAANQETSSPCPARMVAASRRCLLYCRPARAATRRRRLG